MYIQKVTCTTLKEYENKYDCLCQLALSYALITFTLEILHRGAYYEIILFSFRYNTLQIFILILSQCILEKFTSSRDLSSTKNSWSGGSSNALNVCLFPFFNITTN